MTAEPDAWAEVDAWLDPLAGHLTTEHLNRVDSYRPPAPADDQPHYQTDTSWQTHAYRHEPA